MTWIEAIGYAGSVFAVLTYWMRDMLPLRIAAVLGCVCFLVYASLIGSLPLLVMELTLLPINFYRLIELLRQAGGDKGGYQRCGLAALPGREDGTRIRYW